MKPIVITQGVIVCLVVLANIFVPDLISPDNPKLLVPIAFIIQILVLTYLYFFSKANRYIPTINVFVSKDDGETYSNNLKSIPSGRVIYLKYEISVKSPRPWFLSGNEVSFDVEVPSGIELSDYSYCKYNDEKTTGANPVEYEAKVWSGWGSNKRDPSKYTVLISETKKTNFSFTVIASNRPRKSEIIFKIPKEMTESSFNIKFIRKKNIHEAYSKSTTLEFFQESTGKAKPGDSPQKFLYINFISTDIWIKQEER
jgi:hypothetical protein